MARDHGREELLRSPAFIVFLACCLAIAGSGFAAKLGMITNAQMGRLAFGVAGFALIALYRVHRKEQQIRARHREDYLAFSPEYEKAVRVGLIIGVAMSSVTVVLLAMWWLRGR